MTTSAGKAAAVWLLGCSLLFAAGCARPAAEPELVELKGPTMGTSFSVSCFLDDADAPAEAVLDAISERLRVLNTRMSTYDPESELSRFNAGGSTDWAPVSEETARVTDYSLGLARASGGAFDPTVGPLVNLWGFGPEGSEFEPPSDESIVAARAAVGHGKVEVSLQPPALKTSDPAVYVDLSATAKGHGVDAIAELLEDRFGVEDYLVEIGGEIRTRGVKADGSPWRVGVEAPDDEGRRVQRVIEPGDAAIATSGDYRNFFEADGVRYSHTIDPATGRPVTHDLATVSVVADTCLEADGLATALLVMGPERGYDWAVERDVAALFVTRGEDDRLAERSTPAWEARLAAAPPSPATP